MDDCIVRATSAEPAETAPDCDIWNMKFHDERRDAGETFLSKTRLLPTGFDSTKVLTLESIRGRIPAHPKPQLLQY